MAVTAVIDGQSVKYGGGKKIDGRKRPVAVDVEGSPTRRTTAAADGVSEDRAYPGRPFVGVGVAVFRGDEVLLVRRARPPVAERWSIPGGAQEIGETVREAALRELREETGLEARIAGLIDVVDGITRDAAGRVRYHYTLVDFAAVWVSGTARAASDAADVRWAAVSGIEDVPLWRETRRIIRRGQTIAGGPVS